MKILIDKQLVEDAISELISAQVESHFLAKQYVIDNLQSALETVGWISTEEKLPTEEERVLVYATGENVVISRLWLGETRWVWIDDDQNTFRFETVKYWQPLPEEPN